MSYYRMLGLKKEPFSTSPDPSFFYLSQMHRAALFRTRIAIELRRGLSCIIGDIGTGKTTLARRINQIFHDDPKIDLHVILNPMHRDESDFLKNLLDAFHIRLPMDSPKPVDCLHAIERYLFKKGLEENKTVVLLVDEAQQLSEDSLEVLRALLNYETNEFKLLQVVLFGQPELATRLKQVPNFWDRISTKVRLTPLDFDGTCEMIEYRLRQAQYERHFPLFTMDSLKQIYRKTHGLPRRVTMLCHDALEYLVMHGELQVNGKIIKRISRLEELVLTAV